MSCLRCGCCCPTLAVYDKKKISSLLLKIIRLEWVLSGWRWDYTKDCLSSSLFSLVMDRFTGEIRQESVWNMMLLDNNVICSESREQVEESLERLRYALKRREMKVSRSKTECICVTKENCCTVRMHGV